MDFEKFATQTVSSLQESEYVLTARNIGKNSTINHSFKERLKTRYN